MNEQLKSVPVFANEAEERVFWESHDSAEYVNWDDAVVVVFPNLPPATAEEGEAGVVMAASIVVAD